MDLPPVPEPVTALVTGPALPRELARHLTPAGTPADGTTWSDVADAADRVLAAAGPDDPVRGVVALVAAYARLDGLEELLGDDVMDADDDRAIALLHEAESLGVAEADTAEVWRYLDHMRSLAAELQQESAAMEEYIALHGASPRRRLDARLSRAHELYAAGDRAAGVALFREVAEISPWSSEFGGCLDLIDIGWCRLLHDAARHEGPDAARQVWHEARAHYRAATFPVTGHAWRLVEMLLGTGVPDIIEVIMTEWIEAANRRGVGDVPVDEEVDRVFQLALAELEAG